MKMFQCPSCASNVFFDNLRCNCGTELVFDPLPSRFVVGLEHCSNREKIGCNWTAASGHGTVCRSCDMTEVIPDPALSRNGPLWAEGEEAKRWVLTTLDRWGWFGPYDIGKPPKFHFLAEATRHGKARITMGHADGLITMNVMEADPVIRTSRREKLGENYRTMMGHLRHELAHFIFQRMSEKPDFVAAFRALFGDERADYGKALTRHYDQGPPQGWEGHFITPYASAHPHEDWAETVAHLMHLTDILDSSVAVQVARAVAPERPDDPYTATDSEQLILASLDLGLALNHVNRAMGLADLYPFVLSPKVREKLIFAHQWIGPARGSAERSNGT